MILLHNDLICDLVAFGSFVLNSFVLCSATQLSIDTLIYIARNLINDLITVRSSYECWQETKLKLLSFFFFHLKFPLISKI